MASADTGPDVSSDNGNTVVNEKNRDWHRQLRLRKGAAQLPTMQRQDKAGPKKITEEREQNTERHSTRKPPHKAQRNQHTSDSGNTLRFRCCQCKDSVEFCPDDLVKHFQDSHKECSPVFPCHVCSFTSHTFSFLRVHLISHMDSFSSCNICNDNVQRTVSEFTTHLTKQHREKGKYLCKMCDEFTTRNVRLFLEHMHLHNMALERCSKADHSSNVRNDLRKQLESKTTPCSFHCQFCNYESSSKRLLNWHINVVHADQNSNHKNNKTTRHRMTRNAVKEMQECLALQGRDFLDKYCSLKDPEKTLEETQQFLMRSTAGETDGQKWTKALQTVLSEVPEDKIPNPKLENGLSSDSGFPNTSTDVTVLTVYGTTDTKGIKSMSPSEKQEAIPSETASILTETAHCVFDMNNIQSNSNDQSHDQQPEMTLSGASLSSPYASPKCSQTPDNRENQALKVDQNHVEHHKVEPQESKSLNLCEGGADTSEEQRLKNKRSKREPLCKTRPKKITMRRRWKRNARAKKKGLGGSDLKLVLKKNPVKDKQWMSESSLCLLGGGLLDDYHRLPHPQKTLEETQQFLQRALSAENGHKKWTKAPSNDLHNPSKAITPNVETEKTSVPEKEVALSSGHHSSSRDDLNALMVKNKISIPPHCTTKAVGFKMVEGKKLLVLKVIPSARQGLRDGNVQQLPLIEEEIADSSSGSRAGQSSTVAEHPQNTSANDCPDDELLNNPGASHVISRENNSMSYHIPVGEECSSNNMTLHGIDGVESSNLPSLNIPLGKTVSEDACLTVCSQDNSNQTATRKRKREPSVEHSRGNGPSGPTTQEDASPATGCHWQPAPKNVERTLKLMPLSPTQLIKHPEGDQPVVVLNHPDTDIPEVANIMEVIHRYRGEVRKVVLSCKTLQALSAISSGAPGDNSLIDPQTQSPRCSEISVKERFILKLKLKRVSKKKYQVVKGSSQNSDLPARFRCWFCGRAFASQAAWKSHGQRHIMEWDSPHCEKNVNVAHTG